MNNSQHDGHTFNGAGMHFSSLIEVCKARSQLGRIKLFLCAGAACLAMIGPAAAQPQSNSSIRLIVPFPAGGGPDLIARTIAPGLAERMGKNVIVDNRPGSGGIIGTLAGAQAAPDGLTITFGSTSSYAAGPALNKSNVLYDATRDFIHIGMIGRVPVVLIVKADGPFKNMDQLLAAAKQKPGDLNVGYPGNGSAPHLLGEIFLDSASIKVTAIPFRGGPDSLNALLSGNISYAVTNIAPVSAQISAGKVNALAVSGSARTKALPNTPTFAELGFKGLDGEIWYVLSAPLGTDVGYIKKFNIALNEVLKLPQVKLRLEKEGLTVFHSSEGEASAFIRTDIPKWIEAAQKANAKIE